jgi:hypothetical protein
MTIASFDSVVIVVAEFDTTASRQNSPLLPSFHFHGMSFACRFVTRH